MCEQQPRYSSNTVWSLSLISFNGCYLQRTIYTPNPNAFRLDHWKIIMKDRSEVKYNIKYVTRVCFLSQSLSFSTQNYNYFCWRQILEKEKVWYAEKGKSKHSPSFIPKNHIMLHSNICPRTIVEQFFAIHSYQSCYRKRPVFEPEYCHRWETCTQ